MLSSPLSSSQTATAEDSQQLQKTSNNNGTKEHSRRKTALSKFWDAGLCDWVRNTLHTCTFLVVVNNLNNC